MFLGVSHLIKIIIIYRNEFIAITHGFGFAESYNVALDLSKDMGI